MSLAKDGSEHRRKNRLKQPRRLIVPAFAVSICFQLISINSLSLFDYASVMLRVDQPILIHEFDHLPVVVQIVGGNSSDYLSNVTRTPHGFRRRQDRKNEYWVDHNDPNKKPYRRPEQRRKSCVPLGTWQDEVHPSCLDFHEIDFGAIKFAADGNNRDTWLYREFDGTKRALKMLRVLNKKFKHEYDHITTDRHRVDAMAHLELSASPYVANVYGYCSNSAVYDFADGGHLWLIYQRPEDGGPKVPLSKEDLFKFAHDAAMALADAHHVCTSSMLMIVKLLPYYSSLTYVLVETCL